MENLNYIEYTLKHRVALKCCIEKYCNTSDKKKLLERAKIHDMDKVIMYLYMTKKEVNLIHRNGVRHHFNSNIKDYSRLDYLEMIFDWECARYTKEDKPLNAYDTLYKFYPEHEKEILPLLKELKLDYSSLDFDKEILEETKNIVVDQEYIKKEINEYLNLMGVIRL